MEEPQEQDKKQDSPNKNYDWLKGWQFVKGKSGNPGGRKKGSKSLKVFAREYLENLPSDEKIKFLSKLPPDLVWRMSEGNPKQDTDVKVEGEINMGVVILPKRNENTLDTPTETGDSPS